ncbi:hypothetical protein ELI00_09245 [Rhizobium ruizarguesonis]|nr:hypothetical protein ELI00_09245 [Rhizobium ruizarguesonis]
MSAVSPELQRTFVRQRFWRHARWIGHAATLISGAAKLNENSLTPQTKSDEGFKTENKAKTYT